MNSSPLPHAWFRRLPFAIPAVCLILLACSSLPALAGFGGAGPGGSGAVSLGGGMGLGKGVNVDAPIPQATVDLLKNYNPARGTNPFRGKTDAEVRAKIRDLRRTLLRLLPIMRCENAAIAACVQKALETNRICIDTSRPYAAASIQPDNLPTCGNEPINIGVFSVPCTTDLASVAVFQLASLLLHEGLHGIQDWRGATAAERMKVYHANEEAASELQERTACEYLDALQSIIDGNPVPANTPAFAKKFALAIESDKALSAAQKIAKATAIRDGLKPLKDFWASTKLCRRIYKIAYCLFIDGVITRAKLNDIIRQSRWFRDYGNVAGLGTFSFAYFANGSTFDPVTETNSLPPYVFIQVSGTATETFQIDVPDATLDQFYGGLVHPFLPVIMFMVGDSSTGDGYLISYEDTDSDGFFEENTFQQLIQDNQIFGGFDIALNPATEELIGFNSVDFAIYQVQDQFAPFDGLPDSLNGVGNFPITTRDDLLSLGFSDDGRTLYAMPLEVPGDNLVFIDLFTFETANDLAVPGFFQPGPVFNFLDEILFPPAFFIPPLNSEPILLINGPPNHQIQVWDVSAPDPLNHFPVGNTLIGPNCNGQVNLGLAPPSGAVFELRDLTGGQVSAPQEVYPTPIQPIELVPVAADPPHFLLNWLPGQPVQFSEHLDNWQTLPGVMPPLIWYPELNADGTSLGVGAVSFFRSILD